MDKTEIFLKKILVILNMQKPLISISEAALYFDVSDKSISRLLKKNDDIICIKEPGIGRRIVRSTLDKHFEEKIKLAIEKKEREEEKIKKFVEEISQKYLNN